MPVVVSVVMSVYNDQACVSQAIKSILSQTFSEFELIIIDDGSTDNSAIEVMKFSDLRIRFFQQPNSGLAQALNFGITVANGKYIARQDSDDFSAPTRLEQQIKFLDTHPEIGLVGCNAVLIDEDGQILANTNYPTDNATLQAMLLDENSANPLNHGTVVFSRILALSVGGYRKEFSQSQDLDLWLRMAEKLEIANLPEPAYFWRLRRQSVNVQGWNNQRDLGRLARLCARQRQSGQPEPELSLLSTRRNTISKINMLLRKVETESEYNFRIALLLFNQNSMGESRSYLKKVMHRSPFHLYTWLIWILSLIPKRPRNALYHWMQAFYRRIV